MFIHPYVKTIGSQTVKELFLFDTNTSSNNSNNQTEKSNKSGSKALRRTQSDTTDLRSTSTSFFSSFLNNKKNGSIDNDNYNDDNNSNSKRSSLFSFLTNNDKDTDNNNTIPLLKKMATDKLFLDSLKCFQTRTLYCNLDNDLMVGWETSSLNTKNTIKPVYTNTNENDNNNIKTNCNGKNSDDRMRENGGLGSGLTSQLRRSVSDLVDWKNMINDNSQNKNSNGDLGVNEKFVRTTSRLFKIIIICLIMSVIYLISI